MPRRKPNLPPHRQIAVAQAWLAPSRTVAEPAEPQPAQPEECRLAYGLESQFGRVCSRKGGNAICGACISDPDAPALGFRRRDGD